MFRKEIKNIYLPWCVSNHTVSFPFYKGAENRTNPAHGMESILKILNFDSPFISNFWLMDIHI